MSRQPFVASFISCLLILLVSPRLALCQQTASTPGEMLTLEQATALALRSNRQVKIKALAVDQAEDQIAEARTSRLPSFNIYTLASQQLSQIDFRFAQGVFGTFPGTARFPTKIHVSQRERSRRF
jgi:outer membrane protein TolC